MIDKKFSLSLANPLLSVKHSNNFNKFEFLHFIIIFWWFEKQGSEIIVFPIIHINTHINTHTHPATEQINPEKCIDINLSDFKLTHPIDNFISQQILEVLRFVNKVE